MSCEREGHERSTPAMTTVSPFDEDAADVWGSVGERVGRLYLKNLTMREKINGKLLTFC